MNNSDKIIQTIIDSAIATLNEELPESEQIQTKDDTRLVGPGGALTSLQIVNLLIHLEEGISEQTGAEVDLTTNEELFNQAGPMRTVGTLSAYLSGIIPRG